MALEELLQHLLTLLLDLPVVSTQDSLDLSFRLRCTHEVHPRRLNMLRVTGQDLHLVAALQLMTQWYKLVVHLRADTMTAQEGMYLEGKVECRTPGRHGLDLTLGCEHEDL